MASLLIVAPSYFVGRPLPTLIGRASIPLTDRMVGPYKGLVICYGAFGFGYILPATFLPALAREVVDDPQLFGLAWPVFGIAAALSTVVTARLFGRVNRLRAWAVSRLVMATGIVMPSLCLTPGTIAIAALCVGSTFMVVTMIGMQEASARAPANATALLGLMTAAFAIGQLSGPLFSGILALLPAVHRAALGCAMQIAATTLVLSAAYLWSQSRRGSDPASMRYRSEAWPQLSLDRNLEACPGYPSKEIVGMEQTEEPPTGFEAYAEPSPYLDRIGPLFQRRTGAGVQFGVRIGEHHCNRRGLAHGGLVVALADVALGKTGEWLSQPRVSLLTASLTVDFYGSARRGDWLEAETDVTRVGHQVAFGNCYLRVGDKIVARASAVFNVRAPAPNKSG